MYSRILASLLLASGAIAANTSGYVSAIVSYDETLATNAEYLTAVEMLLTIAPGYYASLQSEATGGNLAQLTASAYDIYTKLPPPYNSVISSVFAAEYSIAAQYGFVATNVAGETGTVPTATGATSTSAIASGSVTSAAGTGSMTTTSSETLVAGTTPTGFATSSGTSTSTSTSKAMAAATGLPFVAGIAAVIGGLAVAL